MITTLKLYILILLSNTTNVDKIKSIYYLTKVEEISISCAIISYETGRMICHNSNITCSLNYNNLLGFFYKGKYLRFNNYYESILYYKKWQIKHYIPYKNKYPYKDYYSFLKDIGYCDKMDNYIKVIKYIKKYG